MGNCCCHGKVDHVFLISKEQRKKYPVIQFLGFLSNKFFSTYLGLEWALFFSEKKYPEQNPLSPWTAKRHFLLKIAGFEKNKGGLPWLVVVQYLHNAWPFLCIFSFQFGCIVSQPGHTHTGTHNMYAHAHIPWPAHWFTSQLRFCIELSQQRGSLGRNLWCGVWIFQWIWLTLWIAVQFISLQTSCKNRSINSYQLKTGSFSKR